MGRCFSPSKLASIFRARGIQPDKEFIAAAGRDYGYVSAWELIDQQYLIVYGDNSETHYALAHADDANDLAWWLEYHEPSYLYSIIHKANLHGPKYIYEAEAEEDSEGPFYIVKTSHYSGSSGPIHQSDFVASDEGAPRKFETYEDALMWIQDEEDKGIINAPGETFSPFYTILAVPK
jgi:hypothetical protein